MKPRELGEIVKVSPTLVSSQRFDPRFGYEVILKLVVNIYPLNGLTKYEKLITEFSDALRNKKKSIIYYIYK